MFTLTINGFRGFKNSSISLSKLNVLIGENSGGKSSLIKLLLLLKQSMEVANKDKKINTNGHILDLGNFDNFIYHELTEKSFSITFEIDSEEYLNFFCDFMNYEKLKLSKFIEKCNSFIKDSIKISFVFNKKDNEFITSNIKLYSKNIGTLTFKIYQNKNVEKIPFSSLQEIPAKIIINHIKHGQIKINNKLTPFGIMLLVANSDTIINYENNNNCDNLFNELAFLLLTQNYISQILTNMHYINPIKFESTRISLKRDSNLIGRITDFDSLVNTLTFLFESKDKKNIEILKMFQCAIQEVGIAEEIKIETNEKIPVSELKVKIAGLWNSIVDVGYGVGLQIPILLQAIICNLSENNETLIIEQPEIHLHPALHAKFIEVLIKYAGNTNLIIETHSEHLIRKLQVLTKNEKILTEKVKINYFKNKTGLFEISNHTILENGHLQPVFPKGFYDNSYILSKELY
jgi:predicted ATPase